MDEKNSERASKGDEPIPGIPGKPAGLPAEHLEDHDHSLGHQLQQGSPYPGFYEVPPETVADDSEAGGGDDPGQHGEQVHQDLSGPYRTLWRYVRAIHGGV